jgi:ABC-type transport system involved in multi-copper enzyme maturation permease subunit
MRLVRAELLKLRRRLATYVVLGVLLVLMALIYIVVALTTSPGDFFDPAADMLRFPTAYATIGEFVFGLGSMLAVVYGAAFAGADWSWGVLRNVVARGESRALYILAKAAGLAIVFAVGVLIAFAFGVVLVLLAGTLRGHEVGNPLGPTATRQLVDWLGLGYPVLLERAALGFAVAVVLQSQLAGAIVGIVLYIGEGILAAIMLGITLVGRFAGGMPTPGDFEPIGPEWYQYLPFGIGDNVLAAASPGTSIERGFEQLFLRPVPPEQAFVGVLAYLALALAVSVVAIQRQEIKA